MAKKRGNNEGSIYKRKNGAWRAQVTLDGQRLSYSAKDKTDAQAWLRKMQDEIDDGLRYESTQLTLGQFMEDWLITVQPTLRHNTHRQYKQVTEQHILPVLGQHKIRELTAAQIQQLYNQLITIGRGLRTVRYVHQVLHRSLAHAVKLGIIGRNPAKAVIPPKPEPKEMQYLDEAQTQQLLFVAQASNDRFYALYHLAITTGMRMGELLGLKWEDLDRDQATLHIRRQLTRLQGIGLRLRPPKTKAAFRRIDLGQQSLNVLKEHRERQFQDMVAAGDRWEENNLVFASTKGTFINPSNLRREFKPLLQRAGLPKIRFHDLRHTAASLMLNNSIPLIVVSRRLGHAQPSITLDVYGHLIPSKQQEAAALMDELLTPIQVELPT